MFLANIQEVPMGTEERSDLGSVMTAVISPTRILLVMDESKHNPRWKLPGGGIEQKRDGGSIIAAAIRETSEEAGIELSPEEVVLCANQRRAKDGTYYPYLCLAQVTEERLETRYKLGDEDGKPIKTALFERGEVPMMLDLLERHRGFIKALEEVSASMAK